MTHSSKQSSWYNEERTILYSQLAGSGSWETFHEARREAYALVESQPHTVHTIMDLQNVRIMPLHMAANMREAYNELPANIGVVIVVGTSLLTQTLYTVVRRVFFTHPVTRRLHLVRTLEQGLELIENYRPDTP